LSAASFDFNRLQLISPCLLLLSVNEICPFRTVSTMEKNAPQTSSGTIEIEYQTNNHQSQQTNHQQQKTNHQQQQQKQQRRRRRPHKKSNGIDNRRSKDGNQQSKGTIHVTDVPSRPNDDGIELANDAVQVKPHRNTTATGGSGGTARLIEQDQVDGNDDDGNDDIVDIECDGGLNEVLEAEEDRTEALKESFDRASADLEMICAAYPDEVSVF